MNKNAINPYIVKLTVYSAENKIKFNRRINSFSVVPANLIKIELY